MVRLTRLTLQMLAFLVPAAQWATCTHAQQGPSSEALIVTKERASESATGDNLLRSDAWRPWQAGYEIEQGVFACNNGEDHQIQRGASQTVILNQQVPAPLMAAVWSRAEGVTGSADGLRSP